jgi:hypothetical protein
VVDEAASLIVVSILSVPSAADLSSFLSFLQAISEKTAVITSMNKYFLIIIILFVKAKKLPETEKKFYTY